MLHPPSDPRQLQNSTTTQPTNVFIAFPICLRSYSKTFSSSSSYPRCIPYYRRVDHICDNLNPPHSHTSNPFFLDTVSILLCPDKPTSFLQFVVPYHLSTYRHLYQHTVQYVTNLPRRAAHNSIQPEIQLKLLYNFIL